MTGGCIYGAQLITQAVLSELCRFIVLGMCFFAIHCMQALLLAANSQADLAYGELHKDHAVLVHMPQS
jgi:hypothetical protein